jgi:TIR domain
MALATTFFSYSRTDSAFVLKLAKDLPEAGDKLWPDQLDIKPGSYWDSVLEAALNSADRSLLFFRPHRWAPVSTNLTLLASSDFIQNV